MRRPSFVFGFVPRAATLISILALAGCGGGGGGNQDSGSGGHTGTGGSSIGTGGHTGSGGNASGGTGGSVTDSGTDVPKADAGTGGAGAGGATGVGGQMDAAMDTVNGTGGSGMGGAGGMDASVDAPADGGGTGGDMDASTGGADADAAGLATSATGVEMVSVPLATTGTGQRYNVQNRANPEAPYNLSGQTLTIRAYAPGAIGGDMSVFFRTPLLVDGAATGSVDSVPVKVALSTITGGFTNVQFTVPAAAGSFDPSVVDVIRIEIEADATFGATFQNPATIVYFDSITSGNGAVNLPFDVAAVGNDFASSGARPLAGSTGPTFLATFP